MNSIPTTKVQTSHTFCGGWLSFVRENNIDIGDICIFELLHKFELQVRILRVGKEGIDGNHGDADSRGRNGSTAAPNKMSRRKPKKKSEISHSIKGPALTSVSESGVESFILYAYSVIVSSTF